MTAALERILGRTVPRETIDKLQAYGALLREENGRQNLISASTLDDLWERHILDSAQLARFEPRAGSSWVDIGSGAGLPGAVLGCLVDGPITLIEPRRLRADFLHRVVSALDLRATVVCAKVERVQGSYDVVTGRAVAPLGRFLEISSHLSTRKSRWVLPKGRSAQSELVEALRTWQGTFHVEQSVTDKDSFIVVGTDVKARHP